MSRLTPYLTVDDGAAAIAFYAAAFGARETGERYTEDGKVGHASLRIGEDELFLSDEFHDYGAYAPRTVGHSTVALVLAVDDVDATYAAALKAGATADREPRGEGGDRRGWLIDPFRHRWSLGAASA